VQGISSKSFKKFALVMVNSQKITVQRIFSRLNDFPWLKGAVACPFSGPADSGKPKWATFKALRNGRKFWIIFLFP
jgi:hypothetical protein